MRKFKGIKYGVLDYSKGSINVSTNLEEKSIIFNFPCSDFSSCTPYSILFPQGIYKFELWGAQGGYSRIQNQDQLNEMSSGKGSYVSGILPIISSTNLFLYIGGKGEDQNYTDQTMSKGGYNGGGNGGVDKSDADYPESGAGGGGSTDIRLIKGFSLAALKSRLIVAAGGGGSVSAGGQSDRSNFLAGNGGKLAGTTSTAFAIPGNQTFGEFGRGQDGLSFDATQYNCGGSSGGSGGGYYGGKTIHDEFSTSKTYEISGAGGSSYISGYEGCDSVSFLPFNDINHTGSPVHYTGITFDKPIMMSYEDANFVNQYGEKESGHFGNGAAKITVISVTGTIAPLCTCSIRRSFMTPIFFFIVLSQK